MHRHSTESAPPSGGLGQWKTSRKAYGYSVLFSALLPPAALRKVKPYTVRREHVYSRPCTDISVLTITTGCLEEWFKFCGSDGGSEPSVCACVQNNDPNTPADISGLADCRTLNMNSSCCNSVLNRLLDFYKLALPSVTECHYDLISNDVSSTVLEATAPDDHLVILPSFTFNCSGCIEYVVLLVELPEDTGETQPLAGETMDIHLWSRYESLNSSGEYLYRQRLNFTIGLDVQNTSIEPHQLMQANYSKITVPVEESKGVCFQRGDVFGFSQPVESDVKIVFANASRGIAYRVLQTMPDEVECSDLLGFVEPSSATGIPQIDLQIGRCMLG